jgi:hypothetical protein
MAKGERPAGSGAKAGKAVKAGAGHDRTYQVVWSAARARFEVLGDDGQLHGFSSDQHIAIGAAVREATHAHGEGLSVIVCVERKDGTFSVEWESPRPVGTM